VDEGCDSQGAEGHRSGWERYLSATEQATRRLAATASEIGLWSHSANTLITNWTTEDFRYITRQDEMV